MIKVSVGTVSDRVDVMVDPHTTTLRQVFEANNVDYSAGTPTLDGLSLKAGDLDKTFDEFRIREHCFLLVSLKLENASSIKVSVGTVSDRVDVMVDPHTATLRQVFEANNVDYSAGTPTLDGLSLKAGDLDKTFDEFRIREHCFLLVSLKLENA